ncbi:MAG: hypothetical protein H6R35_1162 [Bacteroidetes bacterium]|nr:hypothetical protein [Bacteroidota bacterium]
METKGDFRNEHRRLDEEGRQVPKENRYSTNNRILIGVVLVLAGLFLVIRNTGFFPEFIDNVIFSWPMLLVAIGLVMTLGSTES